MSIFEVQTIDRAPEGSRAPLEKLRETFGMVPNVAGIIANSPVLANIFVPLFAGVHAGTFTEAEIQTLLLTNAVTNSCAWAVAFHSYLALKAGLSPPTCRRSANAARHGSRVPLLSRLTPATSSKSGATLARRRLRLSCPPASNRPRRWNAGGQRRLHDHELCAEHRRSAARADVPGARLARPRAPCWSLSNKGGRHDP